MRTTEFIEAKIQQRPVLLISKEHVTSCCEIEGILEGYNLNAKRPDMYEVLNIESRQDCSVIETYLWHKLIYKNRQVSRFTFTFLRDLTSKPSFQSVLVQIA